MLRTAARYLAFVAACLCTQPVLAQTRATSADLTGVVTDESGAVVPGARITVTSLETNLERVALSGAEGRFDVPALPPGPYRVQLELSNFATEVLERVELPLGALVDVAVVLKIARLAEQITVAAASQIVDPHRTAISSVITRQQIEQLPINGRNFISFSLITPAVTPDRVPLQGAAAASGLSFNGQRARSNNITVDGLDNNDEVNGGVRATFSQEAVREFQVLTGSYSAEFGKASGGVVNIVTKSGTNVAGGTLFGYFRDDALNAKEYFERFSPAGQAIDQPKAPYSQKQYGGVFGGPIKKNRTFFFGSFERLDSTASNFVTIDDTTIVNVFGRPVGTPANLLRQAGFPIDTGHVPYAVRSNQFVIKVDHNIRSTQALTVRYNYGDGYNGNTEPWGGLTAQSRGAALENKDNMAVVSLTGILSPRTVNELRFQFADRRQSVISLDPTCGGPCERDDQGGPTVEISGVANAGRYRVAPQRRNNIRYQALDTLSYQAGDHLLKAGIDFSSVSSPDGTLPLHFGGRYIFQPLPAIPGVLPAPVSAIQAFALGLPAAYVQGYGTPVTSYVTTDLSLFAQDQWRPRPNLTVQAGVRYQTQFWPSRTYVVPGASPYQVSPDRNDIGPRVGFSWNPGGQGNTSVHAAYGLYYDHVISSVLGISNLIDGASDGVRTLVLRFPQSLGAWNAPGRRLPESAVGTFPSLTFALDPNLKTSYAHHVSVGVNRALGAQANLAVNLVYVRGFNQLGAIDYNPLVASLGPGRRPNDIGGVPLTSASVLQYTTYGETWYRGLSMSVSKRLAERLQLQASYTWSKAEDNSSDYQSAFIPQNNGKGRDPANPAGLPLGFDPAQERGASQQDQPHRFVFSGAYRAPGAVQLSTIVIIGSGVPYNTLAGADLNADGDGGTFPTDRARPVPGDPASAVPRNAGRLPAESTVDLRVSRTFHFVGKSTIEPLFEVFNLFNTVNYTDINSVFGIGAYPGQPLPTYGQFQRAAPPRQAQIAVRVVF